MTDREQIAAGTFYTAAELAAKPWLARTARTSPEAHRDPNTRPVPAEVKRLADSLGVCAWCSEPGDETSALTEVDHHGYTEYMHPECDTDWHAEHGAAAC
jgi:hypothetical protein